MGRPSTKTLIIIRHAHRDKAAGREADNGLSKKGIDQTRALTKFFERRYSGTKPLVLTSPKLRCVETVLPIADICGVKLFAVDWLLEQGEGESRKEMKKRAQQALRFWKREAPALTILCSHGDWIPEFLDAALGAPLELKKAGWAEFSSSDPYEVWIIQDPKETLMTR